MSNYYETLKIPYTATELEIQDAYDVAYNYWRKLATHHDPIVADQANQTLHALEKIRSVLTDPTARAQYDMKINLVGAVGGLSDPSVRSNLSKIVPPPVKKDQSVQSSAINMQAWVCPNLKCNTPNRIGTKFCVKCGTQTGRACPKCGSLIEAAVEFCAECGINVKQHDREQKRKQELEKTELARKSEEAEYERILSEKIQSGQQQEKSLSEQASRDRDRSTATFLLIGFLLFLCILMLVYS